MSASTPPNPTDGTASDDVIRVLHVDDDEDFSVLTTESLSRATVPLEVSSAPDAATGLDLLEAEPFDCVVSDYEMPGMDGLAFLGAVRERWPDLPFVLFTAKGSEAVASEAIAGGVSDYLPKDGPVAFDRLAARLSTLAERYRAERELASVRRRYELLSSVVADAYFEWDVTTDRVWRSDGYGRIFGYDADGVDVDFDWWTDRLHPTDRDGVLARLRATMASGAARHEDTFRYRLGDGSFGHVAARAHVTYDDERSPLRVTGALTDLSDLVVRDRELERTHARLDLALRGTETGVWEWNVETDEVVWDETTRRLFGPAGGRFDGTRGAYTELIHLDDRSMVAGAIEGALVSGGEFDVEHRLRPDPDGTVRWVNLKGTVVDHDSEPTRVVGIVTDTTTSRERREKLERQTERLAEFASVVSHDLRAPLSVASGYLALIDPDDDTDAQYLAAIERAHDRMGRLVSDILTLARQGESIDRLSPVSLGRVARSAWSMVDTDDATFVLDDLTAPDGDVTVLADDHRLRQVFENLYRNCVDHGTGTDSDTDSDDEAATALTISVGLLPADPDAAREHGRTRGRDTDDTSDDPLPDAGYRGFYVADDGVGIPEPTRERIFEAGYTTTRSGTGFGLAIVHRIAGAHGWTVSALEADGGGVSFEFDGVEFVDPEREGSDSVLPV